MANYLGIQMHVWADYIALSFALAACILCAIQIHHHLYYSHHPHTRKYIIRILLMVIVYSVESWSGLYDPSLSLYLNTARETYEALVIYSFYQLLICSLGGYESVQNALYLIPIRKMPHFFPFSCCCKPWSFAANRGSNASFLRNSSIGVLQYCLVQPLMAIITFILQLSGCHCYGDGEFSYDIGYPYICFIRSASQCYAMYCLILFYLALKKQPVGTEGYALFATMRPIPKFLCIKGVVFFTYWQSVIIAGLVYLDIIQATTYWTQDNIAIGLQDILICFEMFIAAIAHMYAFKVSDFTESGHDPLIPPHRVIFDVANFTDIASDASKHMFRKKVHLEAALLGNGEDIIQNNELKRTNKNEMNSTPTALESKLNDDNGL